MNYPALDDCIDVDVETEMDYSVLEDFRYRVGVDVEAALSVRVLADLAISYIPAEDAACNWLREHGPIFYTDDDINPIVVREREGRVAASDTSGPRECHVTDDGAIRIRSERVVLYKGPETRYEVYILHQPYWLPCGDHTTCTTITSTDKKSLLLNATIVPLEGGTPQYEMITINLLDEKVTYHPSVTMTTDCISYADPSAGELHIFAKLLDTYTFAGMRRCWAAWGSMPDGVIRFSPGAVHPQLHFTGKNAAGVPVRKTRDLSDYGMLLRFEPMFPIMRRRKLAIEISRDERPDRYVSTLVDDRIVQSI
jgi:hypothetical protein